MKALFECEKGQKVKVVKLHAKSSLKHRLISFGIMKESTLEILEHSAAKSTFEIKVGKTTLALRSDEAKLISVEEL